MPSSLSQYLPRRLPTRDEMGWLLMPVVAAISLLSFDRFGVEQRYAVFFGRALIERGVSVNQVRFYAQAWLSGSCLVLMVMLPTVYLRLFPSVSPWGLRVRGIGKYWPIYVSLMAVMLPVLWLVSGTERFSRFYPMYDPRSVGMWLAFEAIYLTQFFCVEYFFRGPMLMRLHRRFGVPAIGMMVVPYSLIHIYKPFPEALGSIVAGLLLGYLAVRIRSIWPGVALHCGVAFSMDFFALVHSGRMAALLG